MENCEKSRIGAQIARPEYSERSRASLTHADYTKGFCYTKGGKIGLRMQEIFVPLSDKVCGKLGIDKSKELW